MKYSKTIYVVTFILGIFTAWCISHCQTITLSFTWTNTNTKPVGFDLMEVAAPPDTNRMILYMNSSVGLLPPCSGSCTWSKVVQSDGKRHYYRISAYDPAEGKESAWSNVASCILAPTDVVVPPQQNGLFAPINFGVAVKAQ